MEWLLKTEVNGTWANAASAAIKKGRGQQAPPNTKGFRARRWLVRPEERGVSVSLSYPGDTRHSESIGSGDFRKVGYSHVEVTSVESSQFRWRDGELANDVHDTLIMDSGGCGEVSHGAFEVERTLG